MTVSVKGQLRLVYKDIKGGSKVNSTTIQGHEGRVKRSTQNSIQGQEG